MGLIVHPKISREHIDQITQIDRQRFNISLPSKSLVENALVHPWTYTVLTIDDNVLGYGLVVPVSAFAKEALKRGEMDEDEAITEYFRLPSEADAFYISSIASRKGTKPVFTSRLVGYTLGSVLRAEKPVFGIAVSKEGENMVQEIGLTMQEYKGPFKGINGFKPVYAEKEEFNFK